MHSERHTKPPLQQNEDIAKESPALVGSRWYRVNWISWLTGFVMLGAMLILNFGNYAYDRLTGIRDVVFCGWPILAWYSLDPERLDPLEVMPNVIFALAIVVGSVMYVERLVRRQLIAPRFRIGQLLAFVSAFATCVWAVSKKIDSESSLGLGFCAFILTSRVSECLAYFGVLLFWLALFGIIGDALRKPRSSTD